MTTKTTLTHVLYSADYMWFILSRKKTNVLTNVYYHRWDKASTNGLITGAKCSNPTQVMQETNDLCQNTKKMWDFNGLHLMQIVKK